MILMTADSIRAMYKPPNIASVRAIQKPEPKTTLTVSRSAVMILFNSGVVKPVDIAKASGLSLSGIGFCLIWLDERGYIDRPVTVTAHRAAKMEKQSECLKLVLGGIKDVTKLCKLLDVSRNTVYSYLKGLTLLGDITFTSKGHGQSGIITVNKKS